jgi:hypothetical protein
LSGCVPDYDLTTNRQQNGTMKNGQQRRANSEADQYTLPKPPVASHQFLIVPGHHSDCIATLSQSKGQLPRRHHDLLVRHCTSEAIA